MGKKQHIRFVCSICGREPEKNAKESDENWDVIDNKPCVHCGGALTMEVDGVRLGGKS